MTMDAEAIRTFAKTVVDKLTASNPRARQRRLSQYQVEAALEMHLRALAARPGGEMGITVCTRATGGYVPVKYGYPTEADWLTLTTDADGAFKWVAQRAYAQCRPRGRGANIICRVIATGQVGGRIFEKAEA